MNDIEITKSKRTGSGRQDLVGRLWDALLGVGGPTTNFSPGLGAVLGYVMAVDPGSDKCGLAVLSQSGEVLERRVARRGEALAQLERWLPTYTPSVLVLGDRTGSKDFLAELNESSLTQLFHKVHIIDEHMSSLEARQRYFQENPPTGLRRLIPRTMQTPAVPFDDYVAVILAERFLGAGRRF